MNTRLPLLPLALVLACGARAERVPAPGADPDYGLVAHYRFNRELTPGATVPDRSGKGFDLTVTGEGIASCPGVQGRGARLSGATLNARENPLAGAEAFTASLWFRTADPAANIKLIAAARWAGGNNASGWLISTHASEFWADDQAGSLASAAPWDRRVRFTPGGWNHLAVTCDGARVREYVNGALSVDIAATGRRMGAGEPMTIGAWNGRFPLAGDLDEIRLYRRALGEADIRALAGGVDAQAPVAAATGTTPPPNLTGRWRGRAANEQGMHDCVLELVEDGRGRLSGRWGSPGVLMMPLERGERLGSDLVRWESTDPGVMRWFVTARITGRTMEIERITVAEGKPFDQPATRAWAILQRE